MLCLKFQGFTRNVIIEPFKDTKVSVNEDVLKVFNNRTTKNYKTQEKSNEVPRQKHLILVEFLYDFLKNDVAYKFIHK